MGGKQTKLEEPAANVINEVKMVTVEAPTLYLIIIIALLAAQFITTIYQLHKKSLRKNYIIRAASMANNLDKV